MAEFGLDQASGLRRLSAPQPVTVVAITGGKGGIGKSNVAINLGTALCHLGREVMVLDGDLGLANVDVLLGLRARFNLEHVIDGECALEDVIVTADSGLHVVPASSGSFSMANLSRAGHAGLIHAFSDLFEPLDVLLIDTAAGLNESVMTFTLAAQRVVVVVCDEPASLTDAYGLIKALSRRQPGCRIEVVTNMTETPAHGRALYEKLARVSHRFLGVSPAYFGNVPYDEYLRRSVQRQAPVIEAYPSSPAARQFKKLALAVDKWETTSGARGGLEFFVERLVGTKVTAQEDTLQ